MLPAVPGISLADRDFELFLGENNYPLVASTTLRDETGRRSVPIICGVALELDSIVWCAEEGYPALVLRDRRTLRKLWSWRPSGASAPSYPSSMTFVPATRTMWTGWSNGQIRIFDVSTRKLMRSLSNAAGVGPMQDAAITAFCTARTFHPASPGRIGVGAGPGQGYRDEVFCGTSMGQFAQFDAALGVQTELVTLNCAAIVQLQQVEQHFACLTEDFVFFVLAQDPDARWSVTSRVALGSGHPSLAEAFQFSVMRLTAELKGNYIGPKEQRAKIKREAVSRNPPLGHAPPPVASLGASPGRIIISTAGAAAAAHSVADQSRGSVGRTASPQRPNFSAASYMPRAEQWEITTGNKSATPAAGEGAFEQQRETAVTLFDERQRGVTVGTPPIARRRPLPPPFARSPIPKKKHAASNSRNLVRRPRYRDPSNAAGSDVYLVHRAISRPSPLLYEPGGLGAATVAQSNIQVQPPVQQVVSMLSRMCHAAVRRRYLAKWTEKVAAYHALLITVPDRAVPPMEAGSAAPHPRGVIIMPSVLFVGASNEAVKLLLRLCHEKSLEVWLTCPASNETGLSVLQECDAEFHSIQCVVVRPALPPQILQGVPLSRRVLIPSHEDPQPCRSSSLLAIEHTPCDFLAYRYPPSCAKLLLSAATTSDPLVALSQLISCVPLEPPTYVVDWALLLSHFTEGLPQQQQQHEESVQYFLHTACVGDRFLKLPSIKLAN